LGILALFTAFLACHVADDSEVAVDSDDTDTVVPPSYCEENGFGTEIPWNDAGPFGVHRHEIAGDFTMDLQDGTTFDLAEQWTGCDSYVFIPDSLPNSSADPTSIWEHDLDELIADSPRNAHYFFITVQKGRAGTEAGWDMADRVDATLAALDPDDAAWWAAHLHVTKASAADLDNWVGDSVDGGIGQLGLAIDRTQQVRGVGSFYDVNRYNPSLTDWPYESNLAYAAHEVEHFNAESERQVRLDAEGATVVPMLTGEVVSQFALADVALPSADAMAGFDTFEIEVDQRCPDPEAPEPGNCGAWDYLAYLWLVGDDGTQLELGRFITSYHRETHWVVDATPMLALLKDGGTRHFKWEWAPSWNVQPTETRVSLRFSNQKKGFSPEQITPLFTGGGFGSGYNVGRVPIDVPIPASAKHVELWVLVTGHGGGTNNCSEFCDHQHEFTVNGTVFEKEFPEAGTADKCVGVDQGSPNQWGTWWYGRGGWCPGAPVAPWIVDLTDVAPAGTTATISYRGLFDDKTPPDGSGDIDLASWIVVSE
jgi:hypothetical protein